MIHVAGTSNIADILTKLFYLRCDSLERRHLTIMPCVYQSAPPSLS